MSSNPRAAAALCLAQLHKRRISLPLALADTTRAVATDQQPLVKALCYGSCRFYPQLQGLLDNCLQKPLRDKDRDIYSLLIIGAYQLLHTRTADHAAVSETVHATKVLHKTWAKNMVNAILRRLQRERDTQTAQLQAHQQAALPQWLYKAIKQHWPQQAASIAAACQTAAPLSLRVNRQKTSREHYLQMLANNGLAATAGAFGDDCITLETAVAVNELPGFEQGFCSVQDEAAQLAAPLLLAAKPERVLDACAAPGGKTCQLLEAAPGLAVTALDNDAQRMLRIRDNLTRLQLNAEQLCADARQPQHWWNGERFDAILLDVPCSATGVMRRHPDIKLLRRASDIMPLAEQQFALLQALWQCLRPGGTLLYVSCSILPAENDEVIGRAVRSIADLSVRPVAAQWGLATRYGRQLLPTTGGHDGFYYALLHKQANYSGAKA